MPETRLTQADDGKTIDLPPDSELLVSLPENPATGYTWAVDMEDNSIAALLDSTYVPGADLMPGSGGQHVFRFGIRRTGIAPLRLKRWHKWEGEKSVVERFKITIRAR